MVTERQKSSKRFIGRDRESKAKAVFRDEQAEEKSSTGNNISNTKFFAIVLKLLAEYFISMKLDVSRFELCCILGYCRAFICRGSGWNQGGIRNDGYWQKREDKSRGASCWIKKAWPSDSRP